MKKWIYLYPMPLLLLMFLPCLGVLLGLWYSHVITLPIALFCAAWILMLLSVPVRRAFPALMKEASRLLQQECDVPGFLSVMRVLRAKKNLPRERYLLVEANYALGLDAGGRTAEALTCLQACRGMREGASRYVRFQLDMAYVCVCAHDEEKKSELYGLISSLEREASSVLLPVPVWQMIRRNLDNLKDIAQYQNGSYDGLRERFVARVEEYRAHPHMRRSMLLACYWLACVYRQQGQVREAKAMYRYVADNGRTLGIVAEAQTALAALDGASV